MALFKKKKDEETEKASSSGNTGSRIAEAVRNLWNQTTAAQERAVRADMEQQRAQTQRVQEAARGLYDAYQRQTEQQARGQIAQQQARTERLRSAAEGLYSAYRKGREQTERAVRADMAQQQAQTRQVRDAARGLYSAYQQQTERAARDQMNMQRLQAQQLRSAAEGLYSSAVRRQQEEARLRQLQDQGQRELYARAAEAADRTNELYQRQLAGTDMGAQADRLMTQPIMERANKRQSSLESGDPNTGAGKYLKYLNAADFAMNSQTREDNKDATYNYINGLNGERERQQGYAAQRGADSGMEKYQLMTDSERGVYNYLYHTQGKTSAEGFLARLDPELNAQYYSGQSAWMSEQANRDTASRIGFTAATVGAQPVRTLSGAAALIEDVIRSDEDSIDPNSEFRRMSALTQDIRGAIAQHYDEQYPNGILGMSGGEIYQTICSALDSTMNAAVAGTVGQSVGALRGVEDIEKIMSFTNKLGSAMMSSEVAASAVAESKQKGYSDVGALSLGMIRGGIEYLSEKIGGEWAIGWMKKNPLGYITTILRTTIPEGVEEVMSDLGNELVNILVDSSYGTEESYILQAHRYFEENGSANPWLDTLGTIWEQERKAFLGGALAALGSGTTFYAQNRGAINQTARTLHTDAKGVVRLMDEVKTENPSAVEWLARITGADSTETLRERYDEIADAFKVKSLDELTEKIDGMAEAGEAIDERMREIGRQAAQEGRIENETAPTERGAVDVNLEGPASDTAPTSEGSEAQTIISSGAETGIQGQSARGTAQDNYKYFSDDAEDAAEYFKQERTGGENVYQKDYHGWTWSVQKKSDGTYTAYAADNSRRNGAFVPNQDVGAGYTTAEEAARAALEYCYAHESEEDWNRYTNNKGRNTTIGTEGQAETTETAPAQAEAGDNHQEHYTAETEDGEYEILKGPNGSITIRRLADGKVGDPTGNIYILANSIPLLQNMETVYSVTGDEIPTTEKSGSNNILKFFNSIGNKVFRNGLGEVLLDKYGAKAASTKQHHPTKVKFMAIASVPYVIQNGRLIHSEFHNGKQSYTYAAPVDFLGKPVYVAAIVHEVIQDGKPTNKFYLDEVVDVDGYRFNIDKMEASTDPKYGATTNSGATETPEMLPVDSILSSSEESNPQNQERGNVDTEMSQNTDTAENGTNPEENAQNTGKNAQSQKNVPAQSGTGTDNRAALRMNPRVVFGSKGRAFTNTQPVEYQYAVVPLDSLLTSHDRYGNVNAEYPAELQPRDRSRATSQADIDAMAKNLNPELLADSKTAQNGAPIVTDTGIVISGNGRTAAIQTAYEIGNAENYRRYLEENAREFGIDPKALPENPVLVRVAADSGNAAQLARDLNVTTTAAMSATETAMVDAEKLQELMERITPDENTDLTSAGNRSFVQTFVEEIVPESERGSMYDENGNLSKSGLTRIQNAIFATAYGNEERLARLAEYTDDTAKNITKALVNAANSALQLQSGVKNGTAYDVDVTGGIMQALDLYEESRSSGQSFEDFMAQYRMEETDGTAWDIAQFIAAHKRSAKAISEYFSSLYTAAMESDPNQISLFGGENNGPTVEDILREAEHNYLERDEKNFLGYEPGGESEARRAYEEEQQRRRENRERALAERALGVSEKEKAEAELAEALTEGGTPAITGEPADIDTPRHGSGVDVSDLFGPTSAENEAKATEKTTKEGNAALKEFADSMPDDPMDLYAAQQPVTTRKGTPGEEKITTHKFAGKQTFQQKVSDAWHRFIRSMVNEGDAVHQAGRKTGNKALDGMYFYAKAATLRAQQWIQGQRMDFNLEESGAGLNAIFDPIRAKGGEYYRDFQLYMYHMLNVERMSRSRGTELKEAQALVNQLAAANPSIAGMTPDTLSEKARQYKEGGGLGYLENEEQGELIYEYWKAMQELKRAEKAQNKPIFGWGEDAPDADASQKAARDLLAAHPEFKEEAQKVYDYCEALLQYKVDSGLITEENKEILKKFYPHYVPVMYDYDGAPEKIRKGGITVSSTVKKAKGGSTTLLPLHYALTRQTLAVMRNAGYQQLGAEILHEYENNPELMSRWVLETEESDAVWDESMADNDDEMQPYENVVTVFRGGKRYDLTLDNSMADAFNSLKSRQRRADFKIMAQGNDLFKKLCTAYNPLFMLTNPIRDVQDAVFYSTDTKRWMMNYPKAIKQIAGSGKYWQMYKAMGGVNNSYFDWATGENAGKRNGKMGRVEALNLAIEQAPRLAEFMTVLDNAQRKNGKITQADRMEAFNAAAEVTTNFSRGGTIGKWVNRNLVPFWNPGVQGLSKAVRTVTETRGFKAWAGLTLKAAALGMLPTILNGLLYRDDDEWDKIDDQMKMDYYLFKSKDGVWVKIPKGRVLAALSAPAVGVQESLRGDDVDWGELGKAAFGSVAPNNPLETNLFSTAIQARLWDKNDPGKTWYGGNIESKRLQSYAPGERYDESTDIISKWLGQKLNLSPKKINYVIDQYSGVFGDLILPYLTPKAERGLYLGESGVAVPFSNAFMSRFTTDTVTSNTISKEYYGLLDELGFAAKGGDKPSAVAERYMNRAGSTVSDYYAQIREIENDPKLTDAEKTKLTRELRKKLNEFEKQVTEDAGKYLEAARKYLEQHPEFDYTDDKAVDAFMEGYNSQQSSAKYHITADGAVKKMKDEVYREVNREHFGAEYALQVYSEDTYAKAKKLHDESGLSFDDFYDYYFGTRYLHSDKDEDGKAISGSKKEKIAAYIDDMDLPDDQKDELFLSAGYKEDTLEDAPWNGGSGIYAGGSVTKLTVPKGHEAAYQKVIDANVQALRGSGAYQAADKKGKKALEKMLQDYAKVKAIREADPKFEPASAGYGWTKWADQAQKVGISLTDAIGHMTALGALKADYDKFGKAITGSKKKKVCAYIDALHLTNDQKDALYLSVYKENSLKYTPWHGYKGGNKRRRRGGRRGGRRRKASAGSVRPVKVGVLDTSVDTGIDVSALFGGGTAGKKSGKTSAGMDLLQIINKFYGGNPLAAAVDGGAKARTSVDFKL